MYCGWEMGKVIICDIGLRQGGSLVLYKAIIVIAGMHSPAINH